MGEIKQVDVNFGFEGIDGVERLGSKELGGGTILDLGVYVIQIALFAFQDEPVEIKAAEGRLNKEGVDLAMKAELKFKNGGIATVRISAVETFDQVAVITGTKGTIKVLKHLLGRKI